MRFPIRRACQCVPNTPGATLGLHNLHSGKPTSPVLSCGPSRTLTQRYHGQPPARPTSNAILHDLSSTRTPHHHQRQDHLTTPIRPPATHDHTDNRQLGVTNSKPVPRFTARSAKHNFVAGPNWARTAGRPPPEGEADSQRQTDAGACPVRLASGFAAGGMGGPRCYARPRNSPER